MLTATGKCMGKNLVTFILRKRSQGHIQETMIFSSLSSGFNERLELFVTFKELRCVHTDHNETVIVTSCD